jgi:hypothetical protein
LPIPGSPDLAVEVISPSEYASQSLRKAGFYLDHGTREVWQIYPDTRELVIYGPQGRGRKCCGDEALASWLGAELEILCRLNKSTGDKIAGGTSIRTAASGRTGSAAAGTYW